MTLYSKWHDAGREPQCKPDPAYPDGMRIDASQGSAVTCSIEIPYPAPRCGHYVVACTDCPVRIAITAAGRPDDPRSIKLACKRN